ncbi:arylformamidase [Mechercharimyces sp. CAU 1602]|uniref:arylformamidase n=1 Tax=Mechercharimyces sp. CAU 1602 TaxID=2973933 RepID=UPI0021620A92|nr:arylformamidase [Mechercharimyces sp. CAU 1602]MCS1351638.1 arylformamidase [Mechercharimyces sp. CAU 1602]
MMKWIDISQPLQEGMPVWPGDTPFSYDLTWTKEESGSVNVGQINLSTHTGTHVDAPFHFDEEGAKILDLDLSLYVGEVLVLHLPERTSIGVQELLTYDLTGVERLFIRTDAWKDYSSFPESITYMEPEIAPYLADKGVRLLGLDVPSVDPLDSKELRAHHALHAAGIHILEGAVLDQIDAGKYELIALPLPLKEADGSPVRAVLRPL